MKYIRIQRIVKKICDENVNDTETIKTLLRSIQKKQLFCSIVKEVDCQISSHPKIRILDVEDDCFWYRSFDTNVTMKDKLKYENLKQLKLETEIEKTMDTEDKDSRWFLLDIEQEDL